MTRPPPSTSEALFPQRSASILAPLLIGIGDVPGGDLAGVILVSAAECVPTTTVVRNVPAGRKSTQAPFSRTVYVGKSPAAGYSDVVRCSDRPDKEGAGYESVNWDVSFLHVPVERYQAEFPDMRWVVRLDVTHFRIRTQAVVAARQLALFRYLFAESCRALDPYAAIHGGQYKWQSEWWPDKS